MLSPIALFVYNRPWHTRQTLEALSANHLASESKLIIFADGAKEGATHEDLEQISEVRRVIKEKQWCESVEIIESKANKGLKQSVIDGVTQIVNQYGKVIVLEDDLITSPWFLTFMNEGLENYENHSNIYSINGYMFPIETEKEESILLPYTSTWGWATWREKWAIFEINKKENEIVAHCQYLNQRFNLADYDFSSMLINAKHSWGIHWYFSVFKRNGLGVFPSKTLVQNNGFDGSGVNCENIDVFQTNFNNKITINHSTTIDLYFYSKYLEYFKKLPTVNQTAPYTRIIKKIFKTLKKIVYYK